jgi:uroporphyrinogen decarboxylase
MRQAGRFDPEYRRVRERTDAPLEVLFRTPEIAAEISLLPQRLGVDAIIFYQDILTPLAPLGAEFVFRPGPVLAEPVRTRADLDRLRTFDVAAELPFVGETLRILRRALQDQLPLLGFAGAPLTLLYFLAEGGSPGPAPTCAPALLRSEPAAAHALLARLADLTADYLAYQAASGAQAVQLFESVGDLVDEPTYRTFAHPYHVRIFERLSARVPTILFVKERPWISLMANSGADVLSVGQCIDLHAARRELGGRVALQGNIDNRLLLHGTFAQIDAAVRACVSAGGQTGHILNLNHGLLKDTPIENVQRLIDTCKQIKPTESGSAP